MDQISWLLLRAANTEGITMLLDGFSDGYYVSEPIYAFAKRHIKFWLGEAAAQMFTDSVKNTEDGRFYLPKGTDTNQLFEDMKATNPKS